jgi:hypothetical protein
MAVDHPRHDELAGRIDHMDIATARGYGRRPANSRNPIICDADNTILYDLTVDRIEDSTADNVQERHRHLLACLPCVALRSRFPMAYGCATLMGAPAAKASYWSTPTLYRAS